MSVRTIYFWLLLNQVAKPLVSEITVVLLFIYCLYVVVCVGHIDMMRSYYLSLPISTIVLRSTIGLFTARRDHPVLLSVPH